MLSGGAVKAVFARGGPRDGDNGLSGQRPVQPGGYTCPRCGRTSYHPEDLYHGYCGACHDFTGPGTATAASELRRTAGKGEAASAHMLITWNDPYDHRHGDFREDVSSLDELRLLMNRIDTETRETGALTDVMLSAADEGPHLLWQAGADRAILIWTSPYGTSFTSWHSDGPPLPDLYRGRDTVPFAPSANLVSRDRAIAAAEEFYTNGGEWPSGIIWQKEHGLAPGFEAE